MLWAIIIGLISVWGIAMIFSFTAGGFIHLLPLATVPLFVAQRMRRPQAEAIEYSSWKKKRHDRLYKPRGV